MTAWGPDTFDRDEAYGELALLLEQIVQTIRDGFTLDAEDWIYGEGDRGEAQIMANVDILHTLGRHYGICPDLELEEVELWQRQYLATFDRIFELRDVVPEMNLPARRSAIDSAFNRLADLLLDFEDEIYATDEDED